MDSLPTVLMRCQRLRLDKLLFGNKALAGMTAKVVSVQRYGSHKEPEPMAPGFQEQSPKLKYAKLQLQEGVG